MGNSIVKVKKKKKNSFVKFNKDKETVVQHSANKVKAYTVFLPVCLKPVLDLFELTALRYMRQGETQIRIEEKLNIPMDDVLSRLREKKIINSFGAFSYTNMQEWFALAGQQYVKAIVFFDTKEGMFFNTWFYPNEIKGPKLTINLGYSYISLSEIEAFGKELHVLGSYELDYQPDDVKNNLRRITDSAFEYLDYVLLGLPQPV